MCLCQLLPLRSRSLLLAIALGGRCLIQELSWLNPVKKLAKAVSGFYTKKLFWSWCLIVPGVLFFYLAPCEAKVSAEVWHWLFCRRWQETEAFTQCLVWAQERGVWDPLQPPLPAGSSPRFFHRITKWVVLEETTVVTWSNFPAQAGLSLSTWHRIMSR